MSSTKNNKKKNETKKPFEDLFGYPAKYPFLSVTVMCALLFFFGYCQKESFTKNSYIYAGWVAAVVCLLAVVFSRICRSVKEAVVVYLTVMFFITGGLFLMYHLNNSPALLLWMSLFLLAVLCIVMWMTDSLTDRNFIMLMVMAGVMLRLTYVIYTGYLQRQHDVGWFNWKWGHANYIEYWYYNDLLLPDFDVREIWQYYHPPLHHWLMALLLKLLTTYCGMTYAVACEALQILPMLYSSLIMVVSYRIFRIVKLGGMPLVIAMAIVCFHPTFVLIGGFYNNDTLCVLLMMLSILFALQWYRNPTWVRIIMLALSVGLGMMTKLSGWMVAPAIAVLFLYVFVKNIKAWKKYIGQYAVFGVICAPLGLWWQVRNYFKFDIPLTFVPYLSETNAQYCGNMSASERLFDFGNGQLDFVYDAFTDPNFGATYNEYNPTVGLFKTAVFGEGQSAISDIHYPQIAKTGPILFWVCAVLGLLAFIAFVVTMIRKDQGMDGITRIFFSVLAATLLGSYYVFCFKFPFTCTMNIRYCIPLIPLFAMGLGLLLRRFSRNTLSDKILRYSVYALTAAFVVMTCLVYSQIDLPVPAPSTVVVWSR